MEIKDIISSLSIIIVFVTVLYNYYGPKADELIKFKLSSIDTNKDKLIKKKREVISFIWFNWFFTIFLLNIISTWLVVPKFIKIIKTHNFDLYNFEIESTIFCLITIYLFIFSILAIIKFIELIRIKNKINKKILNFK